MYIKRFGSAHKSLVRICTLDHDSFPEQENKNYNALSVMHVSGMFWNIPVAGRECRGESVGVSDVSPRALSGEILQAP